MLKIRYTVDPLNQFNFTHFLQRRGKAIFSLLNQEISYIPCFFTIKTINGSYKFNREIIESVSPGVRYFLSKYPEQTEITIDKEINQNAMKSLETLCRNFEITISKEEIPMINEACLCLNFLPFNNRNQEFSAFRIKMEVEKKSLNTFLLSLKQTFPIISNGKKYPCNPIGINSSKLIRELREQDPTLESVSYDLEENEDFALIQQIFNYQSITIDHENFHFLHKVANDLEIEVLANTLNEIEPIISKKRQFIEGAFGNIGEIEDLFKILYNYDNRTVEQVCSSLLQSQWITTEENIQELVACLLQIIRKNRRLHPYLCDLIIFIDKKSQNCKELQVFLQFLTKQLFIFIENSKLYPEFLLKLTEKGCFSFIDSSSIDTIKNAQIKINKEREKRFPWWENPDYREIKLVNNDITDSILHDDVDKFQLIITTQNININKQRVNFDSASMSLIQYAASCGSINCFKHLLLNHARLSEFAFYCAINGSNNEIIRIAYAQLFRTNSENGQEALCNALPLTIINHNYSIFDWIFNQIETRYYTNLNKEYLIAISVDNCNIHSLAAFLEEDFEQTLSYFNSPLLNTTDQQINDDNYFDPDAFLFSIYNRADHGFDCDSKNLFGRIINNGYYHFAKFISSLKPDITTLVLQQSSIIKVKTNYYNILINAGNLSIFKLFAGLKPFIIKESLYMALRRDYRSIVYYILNNYSIPADSNYIKNLYLNAFSSKSKSLIEYITNLFPIEITFKMLNSKDFIDIILLLINIKNMQTLQIFVDNLLKFDRNVNFTSAFILALNSNDQDIWTYFLDKQVNINFLSVTQKVDIKALNENTVTMLISKRPEFKNQILYYLYEKYYKCKQKKAYGVDSDAFEAIRKLLITQLPTYHDLVLDLIEKDDDKKFQILLENDKFGFIVDPSNHYLRFIIIFGSINVLKAYCAFVGQRLQEQIVEIHTAFDYILKTADIPREKSKPHARSNVTYTIHDKKSMNFKKLLQIIVYLSNFVTVILTNYPELYSFLDIAVRMPSLRFAYYLISHNGYSSLLPLDFDKEINYANRAAVKKIIQTIHSMQPNTDKPTIANYIGYNSFKRHISQVFYESNWALDSIYSNEMLTVNYVHHCIKSNPAFMNIYIYETSLIRAVSDHNIDKIQMIIKHKTFDPIESNVNAAIFLSIKNNFVDVFDILLPFSNINDFNSNNESLFFYACLQVISCPSPISSQSASDNEQDIITRILSNDNFDPIKSKLLDSFLLLITNCNTLLLSYQFSKIREILQFDRTHSHLIDFYKLLDSGKSFFTSIGRQNQIDKVAQLLLDEGADPNQPDKYGVYPLEWAIQLNLNLYVKVLLNSKKIDLSIRFNNDERRNETYLHIAAQTSQFKDLNTSNEDKNKIQILDEFLTSKLIDINIKDDLGETPLMKACRESNEAVIKRLFDEENLDYKCVNNKGEDALTIYKQNANAHDDIINLLKGEKLAPQNPNLHQSNINPIQVNTGFLTQGKSSNWSSSTNCSNQRSHQKWGTPKKWNSGF